jgi:hypothetical protein
MTRWRKSKIKNANRERFLGLKISECSCGEPLYPRYGSRGPHLDALYCKTRFKGGHGCGAEPIKRVDFVAAIESIVVMLGNVDFLMDAVNTALALRNAAPDPARKQREQALDSYAEGRAELLALVRQGMIKRDEYQREIAILEREVRTLEAQIPAPVPEADPKEIAALICRAFAEFQYLEFAEKDAILRGATKRIIVDGHARAITAVTLSGGFLGRGANSVLRSRSRCWLRSLAPGRFMARSE